MTTKKEEILKELKEILTKNKLTLSSAESCTGGLVSSYLTDISGASEFIFQNFVTYSNEAKTKYLGVKKETLEKFGAVSKETAFEMSEGLLKLSDCSVATTGILGPTGGSEEKPVGLVYISVGCKDKIEVIKYISKKAETNNRHKIKKDIAKQALKCLLAYLKNTLN